MKQAETMRIAGLAHVLEVFEIVRLTLVAEAFLHQDTYRKASGKSKQYLLEVIWPWTQVSNKFPGTRESAGEAFMSGKTKTAEAMFAYGRRRDTVNSSHLFKTATAATKGKK